MTCETDFRWTSAACTHTGLVRPANEDACLDRPQRGLWAVADGMGGHALGELASRMIVEALDALPPQDSLEAAVEAACARLQQVNRQLRAEAEMRRARIIGSTVVVLLACGRRCACVWAGDSRIYRCRQQQLAQLTRDHSQLEELRSSGSVDDHTLALVARNLITRAVGAADTLELEVETVEVEDGDIFLLCSDGLSNEVDEQQMRGALVAGDCRHAAARLTELALQGGGNDNISVVVVRAEDVCSTERTALNPAL